MEYVRIAEGSQPYVQEVLQRYVHEVLQSLVMWNASLIYKAGNGREVQLLEA